MKILLLTTKFTHLDGSPWLVSELASEFARYGHVVTVVNVEWSGSQIAPAPQDSHAAIELIYLRAIRRFTGKFGLALRWVFSSFKALRFLSRCLFQGRRFDFLVGFSPCASLYVSLPIAQILAKKSCLIYWDFFPVHNQEIGKKAPAWVLPVLKKLEKMLISQFDRVGCMSQQGVNFFSSYFRFPEKSSEIIPIWTSVLNNENSKRRSEVRKDLLGCADAVIFVFGGQLVEGRGILELCEAAVLAKKENEEILLVICGSGPLAEKVKSFEKKSPETVKYLGQLSRADYLLTLTAADVGVIITAADVSSPSFPSKSMDYMASGLPILAAVEESTDFGDVVERSGIGRACSAGNVLSIASLIVEMSMAKNETVQMGLNAKIYLKDRHSVASIANLITGGVDD